jgi:hypothetical protein
VAGDDLSSISGMEDKHRRALARRQITTLRGLAGADQQVIYRAMGSIKPRPTLSQIAHWQSQARNALDEARGEDDGQDGDQARGGDGARDGDQARGRDEAQSEDQARGGPGETRSHPGEAAPDTGEWHPVASFAVVFMQRRAGDVWERRVEAEQTEVEPERDRQVWHGWECNPLCGWMLGQLGQPRGGEPGELEHDHGGRARPAGEQPAGTRPAGEQPVETRAAGEQPAETQAAGESAAAGKPPGERPRLRIDSAVITDAAGTSDLVTDGTPVADPPAGLVAPTRIVFTVSGARRGTEVQAVARLRGHGEPGRNVADPVAVPASGRAEFDLSQVAAGQLEMTLLAWTPDCTARHVSVSLPAMKNSPGPGEGPI